MLDMFILCSSHAGPMLLLFASYARTMPSYARSLVLPSHCHLPSSYSHFPFYSHFFPSSPISPSIPISPPFHFPSSSSPSSFAHSLLSALQCLYNAFDARGWLRFAGGPWKHGDALLFILSSAQVMYAYVLRPESIPSSYYHFIVKTCASFLLTISLCRS